MPYKDPEKNKESRKKYRKTAKGKLSQRKSRYFQRYPQATSADWEHYEATTSCEVCGLEFSNDEAFRGKCQDHCHTSGKIRGVLCRECNLIEGFLRNPERTKQMLEYQMLWE
jgi:hypothetical protein